MIFLDFFYFASILGNQILPYEFPSCFHRRKLLSFSLQLNLNFWGNKGIHNIHSTETICCVPIIFLLFKINMATVYPVKIITIDCNHFFCRIMRCLLTSSKGEVISQTLFFLVNIDFCVLSYDNTAWTIFLWCLFSMLFYLSVFALKRWKFVIEEQRSRITKRDQELKKSR